MTKKDFFIIIVKLLGLYALVLSLTTVVVPSIGWIYQMPELSVIIWSFVSLLLCAVICYTLLLQSKNIVTFLKLDQGFDTD
jgi:hypothetical protein